MNIVTHGTCDCENSAEKDHKGAHISDGDGNGQSAICLNFFTYRPRLSKVKRHNQHANNEHYGRCNPKPDLSGLELHFKFQQVFKHCS